MAVNHDNVLAIPHLSSAHLVVVPAMTWALILPMVKRYGPWVAVVLVLVGLYTLGRSHGAAKWKVRHGDMVERYNVCVDTAEHAADEVVRLRAAIDSQNDAIARMEQDHSDHDAAVRAAHDRVMRQQATAYERAMRRANTETEELRLRVRSMSVAEACHESWLELAQ
jgi:biopolymer transport protein ExbB/TolQ